MYRFKFIQNMNDKIQMVKLLKHCPVVIVYVFNSITLARFPLPYIDCHYNSLQHLPVWTTFRSGAACTFYNVARDINTLLDIQKYYEINVLFQVYTKYEWWNSNGKIDLALSSCYCKCSRFNYIGKVSIAIHRLSLQFLAAFACINNFQEWRGMSKTLMMFWCLKRNTWREQRTRPDQEHIGKSNR